MPNPKVSVSVVTYNNRPYLETCLRSLLSQSYPNYEVVVSDNGSSDGGPAFIRERFPQVKVIENSRNLGYGGGHNAAARQTTGELVAVVNSDLEFHPDWLKALVEAVLSEPTVGAATAQILLAEDRGHINCLGNLLHFTGLVFCNRLGEPALYHHSPFEVASTSGAAFLIRRELINCYGFFDEAFDHLFTDSYWMGSLEDTDLAWRLALAGYRVVAVPDSIAYHYYDLKFTPRKFYFLECGRYLWLLKNYHIHTLCLFLPAFCLTEVMVWVYAWRAGWQYCRAKATSLWWLVNHRIEIAQRRRKQQIVRRVSDRRLLRLVSATIPENPLIDNSRLFRLGLSLYNRFYTTLFKAALLFL